MRVAPSSVELSLAARDLVSLAVRVLDCRLPACASSGGTVVKLEVLVCTRPLSDTTL